jgi:hypothetical protein
LIGTILIHAQIISLWAPLVYAVRYLRKLYVGIGLGPHDATHLAKTTTTRVQTVHEVCAERLTAQRVIAEAVVAAHPLTKAISITLAPARPAHDVIDPMHVGIHPNLERKATDTILSTATSAVHSNGFVSRFQVALFLR